MASWDGLLVRDDLQDTGIHPNTAHTTWVSPDIIPFGLAPGQLSEVSTSFKSYYHQDISQKLVVGSKNVVYVRIKNAGSNTISGGTLSLYALNPMVFPDYGKWDEYALTLYGTSNKVYNIPDVPAGDVIAAGPFQFTPPDTSHCCMVARVESPGHPNPVPQSGDFGTWIRDHPDSAQRNLSYFPPNQDEYDISIYYTHGTSQTPTENIQFTMTWIGVPSGVQLSLTSDIGTVQIPPQTSNGHPSSASAPSVPLAGGANVKLTVKIVRHGHQLGANSLVSVTYTPVGGSNSDIKPFGHNSGYSITFG